MKPWEDNRTIRKMRKLGGERTVKMFIALYKSAIKILRASLLEQYPRLTRRQLKYKINQLAESIGGL